MPSSCLCQPPCCCLRWSVIRGRRPLATTSALAPDYLSSSRRPLEHPQYDHLSSGRQTMSQLHVVVHIPISMLYEHIYQILYTTLGISPCSYQIQFHPIRIKVMRKEVMRPNEASKYSANSIQKSKHPFS